MDVTLELVPFTVGELVGLVEGRLGRPAHWHPEYPTADTLDAARMLLLAYETVAAPVLREPAVRPDWWLFAIVADGLVVGDAGYHGPPASSGPAEVEIGYQVVPDRRGAGLATRACALLLAHAWRNGAAVVRADAEPENIASRAVLRANGFVLSPQGDFTVTHESAREPARPAWTA